MDRYIRPFGSSQVFFFGQLFSWFADEGKRGLKVVLFYFSDDVVYSFSLGREKRREETCTVL